MRSSPRAAVAAAAALVLLGGLAALSGERESLPVPRVVAAPAPVPEVVPVAPSPSPSPSSPPSVPPAPAPAAVPPVNDPLGPPPGPQVDLRPERVAAPQDRFALLVGVQDYRPPTVDTVASRQDVRTIEASLLRAGWPAGNIRVLLDDRATGAAVREGLAWLAARNRPGAFTFFHWSGHVKQLGGTSEALWTVDRDWVRDTELVRALGGLPGRGWVDVAGCEAGSFIPGLAGERTLVTASSRGTEKSYEHPEWGTSVWTGLLFDRGTTQGDADADADGRVTMGEATRWAAYYAQKVTLLQRPHGRQTPQVTGDPVLGWTLDAPPA